MRNRLAGLFCCSILIFAARPVQGDVSLAGPFADNCVLQRDMPLPIFGFAEPQEAVTVELNGQKESATTGADGKWMVKFKPQSAGGPFTLTVTGKNTLTVPNVLIGEVWIAVGQSNMMMQVASAAGGADIAKDMSKYPNLRMAYEHADRQKDPQAKINPVKWHGPGGGDSAAAFFFALQLYDYFHGKVPVGVMAFTEIDPAQSWADPEYMKTDPKLPGESGGPFAGLHFNSVIKPLSPMALRGGLYYQGEMNAGWQPPAYFCAIMSAVIESWRKSFQNESLPFLFVQLPGFQDQKAAADPKMDMPAANLAKIQMQGPVNGFCELREAQEMTLKSVPNTGMAVTIDVGEQWNIHPANKKAVGDRLFLQARHVAYHDDSVVYSGPLIKSIEFKGAEVIATFDQIGSKLVAKGDKLLGFEMAGADGVNHAADARIEGNKVIISSKEVKVPSAVYYAWAGFPIVSLYNAEGLPAAPFRAYDFTKMQTTWDGGEFPVASLDQPEGWSTKGTAKIDKTADGSVATLPNADDQIFTGLAGPHGYGLNSPVNGAGALRPGDLIGFSIEMKAGPGTGDAKGYFRLFQGGSYWDRPSTTTASETFVPRSVTINIPTNTGQGSGGTFMFANLKSDQVPVPRPYLLRNMGPAKTLRATLGINSTEPIDLGHVAVGATAESKPIIITNTQKGSLPEQTTDAGKSDSVTALFGLADVKRDEATAGTQILKDVAEHVGAIFVKANSADFEFNGANVTDDKSGVKFIGADKGPGLGGGPAPESESFTVRFKGEQKPGTYTATVRIVTQASNLGTLSQGNDGEPPIHLYYVDIPVKVTVP